MGEPIRSQTSYLLHEELGSGGMGVVHLGTLVTAAGRCPVAVKRICPARGLSKQRRERLIAEARLAFRLNHANICRTLDVAENDDGAFLVMEYIQGADLRAVVRDASERGVRLDLAAVLMIGRELARALDYAHRSRDEHGRALGIVHADVTPQNVLLSVEGEVKLTDFGIAKAAIAGSPGANLVGGTPGFMAPEVLEGRADHRADLYSLGASLFTALVGRPPAKTGPRIEELVGESHVTDGTRHIIGRLIDSDPDARFGSAREVEEALAYELAITSPGYTSTHLAELVRAYTEAGSSAPSEDVLITREDHDVVATLVSLAQSDVVDDYADAATRQIVLRSRGPAADHKARTETLGYSEAAPSARAAPARKRSWRLLLSLAALALAGVALAGAQSGWFDAGEPPVARAQHGTKELPNESAVRPEPPIAPRATANPASAAPVIDAGLDRVPVPTPEDKPARPTSRSRAKHPRKRVARVPPAPTPQPATKPGFLTVTARPWGVVYVDGRKVADETPLYRHPIRGGRHTVRVFLPDRGKSVSRNISVGAGREVRLGF